jgi:hypothetical protein
MMRYALASGVARDFVRQERDAKASARVQPGLTISFSRKRAAT